MPSLDSTIVFTAHIYIDGIDKTEALIEANRNDSGLCPDLFDWTISGTSDDEGLMEQSKGIRTISIPASSFVDDNVRVSFVSILNIG